MLDLNFWYDLNLNLNYSHTEEGQDNCTDWSVKLVNSTIKHEGRVEVCADGVWGTVCGVDMRDALVICRTLGYAGGEKTTIIIIRLHVQL